MILDANDIGFLILKKIYMGKTSYKIAIGAWKTKFETCQPIESMVFYAILNRSGVVIVILLPLEKPSRTSVRSV